MPSDPVSSKPLLDKLGVKPGMRVSLIGVRDASFIAELRARTLDYCEGRPQLDSEMILLGVERRAELAQVEGLVRFLKDSGALWVVYPKGTGTVTEAHVMKAGLATGLVDNKVVSFSPTHTGLRFVPRRS